MLWEPSFMENWFDISGLRVLITGGTGGIGTELVGGFLGGGGVVCVLGHSTEALEKTLHKHSSQRKRLHENSAMQRFPYCLVGTISSVAKSRDVQNLL